MPLLRSDVLIWGLAILVSFPVASAEAGRRHGHRAPVRQAQTQPEPASVRPDPDELYRRRGYGIGGSVFGLGQGGTAMAGACADLRFAVPRSCGKGYGVYGNGLGYGFGF